MNKPTRRLLTALALTAVIATGTAIATESVLATPQGDTGWGAPAGDTGWGTPPADNPTGPTTTPLDTAWG